jgi:hypothetical protein
LADEQDRRVEARGAIAGSGMLTDPERIESLQAEAARRERAWRERPKKGFSAVLSEAHHHESEASDASDDTPDEQPSAPPVDAASKAEGANAAVPAEISGLASTPPPTAPRTPPDPRMAALHRLVDEKAGAQPPPHKRSSGRSSRKGRAQ